MISAYTMLVITMSVFSFTTLTQTLWPFPINQLIGAFVFVEALCIKAHTLRKGECVLFCMIALCLVVSFLLATDKSRSLLDAVYWFVTCAMLTEIIKPEVRQGLFEALYKTRRFVTALVIIDNVIILVGFLIPTCYASEPWGSTAYYIGYAVSAHPLCSGACLLLTMTLFLLNTCLKKWWWLLLMIPGTAAIMASGARTFIISIAILCLLLYYSKAKNRTLKFLLFPLFIGVAILAFWGSGMYSKFEHVLNNKYVANSLFAKITSGRSVFWAFDLKAFADLSLFNKLLGNGFDYPYYVNLTQYGSSIWAHNDFIDLLLSVGLFGTAVYAFVISQCIYGIMLNGSKTSTKVMLACYIFIPSLINGVFVYQHYLYSFIILCIAFHTDTNEYAFQNCEMPLEGSGQDG